MSIAKSTSREIERTLVGQPTSDGAGVKLTRLLTQDLQKRLDPFLMLDAFGTDNPDDYIAGFPEHPHRGFETVTYMLQGNMRHRDSRGNEGLLRPGSVQWMTAGSGILHSEMPEQVDGRMEGFQLWLNLPSTHKMIPPSYADIDPADIPVTTTQAGVRVKVIAGEFATTDLATTQLGPISREFTEPHFFDLFFERAGAVEFFVPPSHNAFLYVIAGQAALADEQAVVAAHQLAILGAGDRLLVSGESDTKLIVIAGKPLNEPIAQYGPFVMNTQQELIQAVQDMRSGVLG